MASAKRFRDAPPFPDNVPVAEMTTISLSKLACGSDSEAAALLASCRALGFFLLDLAGDPVGEEMIQSLDAMFDILEDVMSLPIEEKELYNQDPPRSFLGYKAQGVMKTETGAPDRCEFYNVGQDDLLGNEPRRDNPAAVQDKRDELASYLRSGQAIVTVLLRTLCRQLSLPEHTFSMLQPPERPSSTIIRLIRYPPSLVDADRRTGLLPHTDYGTITLLANVIGGLQVLRPDADPEDEGAWRYVQPAPGCLIVNMGDAMVQWTGGVLRSNMHRVSFAPGRQCEVERFSVALLVRPMKEALMGRLQGGRIPETDRDGNTFEDEMRSMTAWEWEQRKAMALKAGRDIARSRGGSEWKD